MFNKQLVGIFVFLFFGLNYSCNKNEERLTFREEKIEEVSDFMCDDACPSVTLDIVIAEPDNIVVDSINNKLFYTVKELLLIEDEQVSVSSYDELAALFLQSYTELKTEFPNDVIGWEATIKTRPTFQRDSILCVRTDYHIYAGGAHGFSGVKSLLFDTQTGKTLTITDIITDINAFTAYCEKKFRASFSIPEKDNINSTEFLFEDDKFVLPETIILESDKMILYYTTEITSYVDGAKELSIKYSEIKQFLKNIKK